jgi:uncharacterized protein (DUF1330 family)
MAKGYWIGSVEITNPEGYKGYLALNGIAFAKYGAKFLVRGGSFELGEGGGAKSRNVILEFKDYATAVACYHSPEYQAAVAARKGAAHVDVIIIEGYDGPQPE